MNYLKIYDTIIERANQRTPLDNMYYEKHHIVPKCMGGSNARCNLVRLTAKEHYIAHLLLAKHYNTKELWFAVISFQGTNSKHTRFTGSMYETARIKQSEYMKTNNPNLGKSTWNRGLTFSEESKSKMSLSQQAQRDEKHECPHCHKLVDAQNYKRWHGDNCKESPNYVKPEPTIRRKPTHKGPRNMKQVTCPHCGVQGAGGNMTRWHFDKCKHR